MADRTRLEHRSDLLAQKMRDTADRLSRQLGQGDRPSFTTPLARSAALDWWRAHRHDEYGAAALARLQPWDIAQLDADLAAAMNPEPDLPAVPAPPSAGVA